ncbi:hypothetical protein C8F01DRAFT_1176196 [Mycena amicta]|nr:hypothetical protein C8F01DRAFT_1176196 [Mycena amicta]
MDPELAFLESATEQLEDETYSSFLRHQLVTSPLLSYSTLKHHATEFPSRGLLGTSGGDRVYVNTNTPSSAVICGVQGSGKSHTVSCILECALIVDPRIGNLPEPLSAIVFHFDTQDTGRPCEAAFISSPSHHPVGTLPQVTVLCSPSNVNRRRRAYACLPQVRVEPLFMSERDLTADRMTALMGCDDIQTVPLYMHTALHMIRSMGVDAFSYTEFKRRLALENLDAKQRAMIQLRLDLLDEFMRPGAPEIESYFTAGGLVLVDLTDPFLDGLTAGVLFDIVLGVFTQWQTACGKLVVLDEAHKYLTNSDSARLTQSVSSTIRLQRHLATRVIIATQEPTVVPETILDLASMIICHRFSSPAWCSHLARHVSAGSESAGWYQKVMLLATGEALVFSPAAVVTAHKRGGVVLLGSDHLKLRVRPRLTMDGGASLLAVGRTLPAAVLGAGSLPTPLSPAPSDSTASVTGLKLPTRGPSFLTRSPSATPTTGSVAGPSTPAPASTTSARRTARREVPASLEFLIVWLTNHGAAKKPRKLVDAKGALFCQYKLHPELPKLEWWSRTLQRAVSEGLVEVTNLSLTKNQLKELGKKQMIRLLESGPFVYV